MDHLLIGIVACLASLLTFFSGFGLGTILTPVFAIFFPIELAIALTGIVHFLNNLFKLALIGRQIDLSVLLRFGLPAIAGAFIGAKLLLYLSHFEPVAEYVFMKNSYQIFSINLVIAALMIAFALFDIVPRLKKIQFGRSALIPGGIVSGFFGGLSGHQGALRSAFLIKCDLSKESFIATGVAIACFVDVSRLSIYFSGFTISSITDNYGLLITACTTAFAGAYTGRMLLKKVTLDFVQGLVSILIILLAMGLALGFF